MSGIYIEGMRMPGDEPGCYKISVIYRDKDGKVYATEGRGSAERHEVIPVYNHGRLGDLDELASGIQKSLDDEGDGWLDSPTKMAQRLMRVADLKRINNAPTIIPTDHFPDAK